MDDEILRHGAFGGGGCDNDDAESAPGRLEQPVEERRMNDGQHGTAVADHVLQKRTAIGDVDRNEHSAEIADPDQGLDREGPVR